MAISSVRVGVSPVRVAVSHRPGIKPCRLGAAEASEPGEDDAGLVVLIERVKRSTAEASAALDAVLKRCGESDRRIEKMQAAHRSKSKP